MFAVFLFQNRNLLHVRTIQIWKQGKIFGKENKTKQSCSLQKTKTFLQIDQTSDNQTVGKAMFEKQSFLEKKREQPI